MHSLFKDLENTLNTLKLDLGRSRTVEKRGNKYIYFHIDDRREVIRHLVNTLKKKGKEIEYFRQNSVKRIIIKAFWPDHAIKDWTKQKRENAKAAVLEQLDLALAEFWPESIEKADIFVTKNKEFDPTVQGRLGKELDQSIFENEPKPNTGIDEEAAKLLGFIDE